MNTQTQKQLQGLMQSPFWPSIEEALKEYMNTQFVAQSARRDTEFATIWEMAGREGAMQHLNGFFSWIEDEAKQV